MKSKFATLLIFIILISISYYTKAKESSNQTGSVQSLNKFKLYLLGVGVEREQKISKQSSLYFSAAIEVVAPFYPEQPSRGSDVIRIDYSVNFAPILGLGFRNYFNLSEKENLKKSTTNNSASYFGIEYNLIAPILINKRYTTNYVHSISPVWGFQRNTLKNKNIELAIGPSFQTDFDRSRFSILARIGFSYLL
ncbi:hypothetical protein EA772_09765 [Pedobacter sp. G11]|uniref:hypothetical protein n=1 Tax=Pedobacter sp. G11 TaxID=2482728 RepID=UPI000F5E2437|nr:hypothetical protein [Pedobacter sp. G11]AZI25618.1 hypothetical protein EA772_09765 [Pedobacter sp. G11]